MVTSEDLEARTHDSALDELPVTGKGYYVLPEDAPSSLPFARAPLMPNSPGYLPFTLPPPPERDTALQLKDHGHAAVPAKVALCFGANGRTLVLDVFVDGSKVRFVNVYAPVTRSETNTYFKELHDNLVEPVPHVVLGDFNCVVDSTRDVRGPGQGGSTYHAKELVKILRHLRLTDAWVHVHGNEFAPTRTSRTTASRLDRAYVPERLVGSIASCEVLTLPDGLADRTDHLPLVTTVRGTPGPHARNEAWRLDPALIKDRTSALRISAFLEETIEATPCTSPAVWDDLKARWRAFLQEEEVQRPDGSLISDPTEIEAEFHDYFEAVFHEPHYWGPPPEATLMASLCSRLPRLAEDEGTVLCGAATEEELRIAIRAMPPNSAPGTDGLTASFYTTFFDVLCAPLLAVVNMVLQRHTKPDSFSVGRIALILKDGAPPRELSSWRPISLLNVDYKIVASILNTRLRTFLPDLIAPHQACAVPGRSMFANLTATRDVFEYAAQKRVTGAFLSLDQAKAFDRVRHMWLFEVLRRFGLPREFVAVVELLYSDLRSCVAVNGRTTAFFRYTRGIRQGCPLGPTLFVLSIEPLLTTLASDERIRGLPMTGTEEIRVLAFADDISLFLKDVRSLDRFRGVFQLYAEASGAKLNERKSRALLFGTFPAEAIGDIEPVSTVKVLGVYFSREGVDVSTWARVVDRAARLAERAALFNLTLREKAVATKTSVLALASYVSRVTVMPARVATRLGMLANDLL
nr:uncharacterized protein LOC119183545 [Rhipicephalus microplus]